MVFNSRENRLVNVNIKIYMCDVFLYSFCWIKVLIIVKLLIVLMNMIDKVMIVMEYL